MFFCGTHTHSSFDVHSHFMNNINVGTQKKTAIFFVDACVCLNVNHAFFSQSSKSNSNLKAPQHRIALSRKDGRKKHQEHIASSKLIRTKNEQFS